MRPDRMPLLVLAAAAALENLEKHVRRGGGCCVLEPKLVEKQIVAIRCCKTGSFLLQVHRAAHAKVIREGEKRRRGCR